MGTDSRLSKDYKHALVWFRNDLRIHDNPALHNACKKAHEVSACFLLCEETWNTHHVSNRRLGLTYSALQSLNDELAQLGIKLHVLNAKTFDSAADSLVTLAKKCQIDSLFFNYEYALDEQQRDSQVAKRCAEHSVDVIRSNANIIIPPGKISTKSGTPFKVFTPFKRAWLSHYADYDRHPLAKPAAKSSIKVKPLKLPTTDVDDEYHQKQKVTEKQALKQLKQFIQRDVDNYHHQRDLPSIEGTSRLSPFLTIGLISPRQCIHLLRNHNQGDLVCEKEGPDTWLSEIIWREFYIHLLTAFPQISKNCPMKPETESVPWRHDEQDFERWCKGETGFPLVDAAMKQLNHSGWMHNRLRMVVATFLTKYLLIDWRWGERYFMEQLTDGHFASNNGGWQWCASTGTDAAPYFRILHPVRQAERFDRDATFIKQWLPALTNLPAKVIHKPGDPALLDAGYPAPMIDLTFGKERCLNAFKK
ncbi:deoxyribodipyrimidine photo-lyase [Aurantivibrio plasticivorans]